MTYVIFDDKYSENFYPITLTRSTGDLRVGILKLRQRITAYLEEENLPLIVDSSLAPLYRKRHPDWQINQLQAGEFTFINSRLRITDHWVELIKSMPANSCFRDGDTLLAARCKVVEQQVSAENIATLFNGLDQQALPPLPESDLISSHYWQYLWELISCNSEYIRRDFEDFFYDKDNFFETETGVTILNPYNVWIGEGSSFKPGVVIDASEGPVVIDENVRIMPNAVVCGPVYIGKNSLIKAGTRIYEGTSIGPHCKIGGEIEDTIIQGYSNKQHDGFLGHSYLGEWINLGADTNNSDLKNNYKPIKIYFYPEDKKINSGCQFLGTLIGDHTKTGINCSINTGTVIGVGCNLFGNDLISGHIPSFNWGEATGLLPYELEAFLQTAGVVKKRRNLDLSETERELLTTIYQKTLNQ